MSDRTGSNAPFEDLLFADSKMSVEIAMCLTGLGPAEVVVRPPQPAGSNRPSFVLPLSSSRRRFPPAGRRSPRPSYRLSGSGRDDLKPPVWHV